MLRTSAAVAALLCALPALTSAALSAAQKAALVSLYNELDGPNWASQWGWCQNIRGGACPEFGDALQFTDPCSDFFDDTLNRFRTWDGIVCDSLDRVIAINLGFNSLDGTDLPDLSALTSLERLFLQSNSIKGSIAGAGWDSMSSLETVHLYSNEFSGPIPASLMNNPNIINLLIFDNGFSGQLPEYTAGGSPDLVTFRFNDNAFTGSLPASYRAFTSMEGFYGADNGLDGVIPQNLFNSMSSLKFVDLDNNNLIGPLPQSLDSGSQPLVSLVNNNLDCALPSGIEHQLVLDDNAGFSCDFPSLGLNVVGAGSCVPVRISTVSPAVFSAATEVPITFTVTGDNFDNCQGRYSLELNGPSDSFVVPPEDLTITARRIVFTLPDDGIEETGTYSVSLTAAGSTVSSNDVAVQAILDCDPLCVPSSSNNVAGCNTATGECSCEVGWTPAIPDAGRICFLKECEDPTCTGKGQCDQELGRCVCESGWTGFDCDTPDRACDPPTCNDNGVCFRQVGRDDEVGECYCNSGYTAVTNCAECIEGFVPSVINGTNVCVKRLDCASTCVEPRGECDEATGSCKCESGFSGLGCEGIGCQGVNECSNRGVCVDSNVCECNTGFTGDDCSKKESGATGAIAGAIAGGAAVLLLSGGGIYVLRKRAIARIKRERGMELK